MKMLSGPYNPMLGDLINQIGRTRRIVRICRSLPFSLLSEEVPSVSRVMALGRQHGLGRAKLTPPPAVASSGRRTSLRRLS